MGRAHQRLQRRTVRDLVSERCEYNNLSLWGNVGVQLGDKGYSDTQGMLGVKYSW
ncbi:TPA: autotransporter outer membrane beta-barrel domain-containing protein [Escherichia coli]|nr:autotransporter outer membrane beta-barrel domain-containing protein [Escherichia coli]HAW7093418.1 autotransporter outer membrane beta-barrel domain-containing protein [Escherichia coli]HAW7109945.1 autotransporter outer membrane beta-barrel domain-containing protein [Escherichia coli]HAW7130072.1 autotransporter outer membrane beta-barrel domain-containing protein [Escherichia coli]HBA5664015.1 autotransporter outer membrane beta-barrel domain-containing protein [Escherichia coli]